MHGEGFATKGSDTQRIFIPRDEIPGALPELMLLDGMMSARCGRLEVTGWRGRHLDECLAGKELEGEVCAG